MSKETRCGRVLQRMGRVVDLPLRRSYHHRYADKRPRAAVGRILGETDRRSRYHPGGPRCQHGDPIGQHPQPASHTALSHAIQLSRTARIDLEVRRKIFWTIVVIVPLGFGNPVLPRRRITPERNCRTSGWEGNRPRMFPWVWPRHVLCGGDQAARARRKDHTVEGQGWKGTIYCDLPTQWLYPFSKILLRCLRPVPRCFSREPRDFGSEQRSEIEFLPDMFRGCGSLRSLAFEGLFPHGSQRRRNRCGGRGDETLCFRQEKKEQEIEERVALYEAVLVILF
mmetsp:Transcript_25315/g.69797  ORF Transcript_25315/g.69797 Transcript_25315/m.69797 type:complete len:282 (+) Transcript_25315:29-874(+)